MSSTDRIERELVINAPVEKVWSAITESDQIVKWLGDFAEIDLKPGGRLVFGWAEHGRFNAVIDEVEPASRLVYRWTTEEGAEVTDGNATRVEYTLAPEGSGTRLRLVENGFDALAFTPEVRAAKHADNVGGWQSELDELKVYVEA
ncbi:SRPBCC domain-containing protein [Allokutzneria sp. NRRL B-24872]|uniref:SRPBCC domain-containing protein n=1 Tax=Allokutzneria sp. NRRL B-24872 TaxID=1137961 RepID=UPI000A36EE20|nr:SRPBCC domain-containing protein [Allokutzneria sp. NRRL B-24872]